MTKKTKTPSERTVIVRTENHTLWFSPSSRLWADGVAEEGSAWPRCGAEVGTLELGMLLAFGGDKPEPGLSSRV